MITADQVMPLLLQASPSFRSAWERHTTDPSYEPGLLYVDLGEFARHLIELWRQRNRDELHASFAVAERLHVEGDDYVKEAATNGLLEGLQNIAGHEQLDPEVFRPMLGPESVRWWDGLNQFWSGKKPTGGPS